MTQSLSTPVVALAFPAGTVDTQWQFDITGSAADGSPFSHSVSADTPSTTADLPAGIFTLVVTKNGISSLPSDPFPVTAPVTVMLSVPDATQKAVIA